MVTAVEVVTASGGAASGESVLFQVLLFAHVVCAVGGFGGLVYRALGLDFARRRGNAATAGVLDAYSHVSGVAEALVYGVVVFGFAALAAAHGAEFHRPWAPAAVAVYVVMVGLLHGLVKPAERRYRQTLLALAQAPTEAPPGRPPQLAELDRLYRRIGAGMGGFNLLLMVALYLMVFKP